jgi:cell division protein FtsL
MRVVMGRGIQPLRIAPWLLFTALVLFIFFALIYSRTALSDSAFDLKKVEAQIVQEQATFQQLRLEVARLQSPERVVPLAEEIGLVLPSQVRTVQASGVSGPEGGAEERWAEVKSILTASP